MNCNVIEIASYFVIRYASVYRNESKSVENLYENGGMTMFIYFINRIKLHPKIINKRRTIILSRGNLTP